jgi:sulfate adenylyltransferase
MLISPCGGTLVDLLKEEDFDDLKGYASSLKSVQLSERSVCDLELIAVGAFSPLDRFMDRENYRRVLDEMRLTCGHLYPIPVTLPVEPSSGLRLDSDIALYNSKKQLLAIMTIEDIYEWDVGEAAQKVFGAQDSRHPLVNEMRRWGKLNISGRLRIAQLPPHHDFVDLRMTPRETRKILGSYGRENVVAFQTRNPLHRAHEELTKRAIEAVDGSLLLHPVVGITKPGDVDHYARVRTYKALVKKYYEPGRTLLSLLPLAMRLAGPREALWHALIRRNYGANYLIVGRDHAGPGLDSTGKPFYGPYDAQQFLESHSEEIGVKVIPFQELVYLPEEERFEEVSLVQPQARTWSISGTQVREVYLNQGRNLPGWFTRPEVANILAETYPPRHLQGICVWLTGLSGAGKTTTAEILAAMLMECGRRVTMLDGDEVRTHLSKGLGFSREDRDANVLRIGFVAGEAVRHGGIVIAALLSPYRTARNEVRDRIGAERFIEVFVDTPLEVCEQRDVKGLYAKARRGELKGFTGIDDPYEPPLDPDITIDTVSHTPQENALLIFNHLLTRGIVRGDSEEIVPQTS